MDVGNFIGELLAQQGDVCVPGLGYFALTRSNGYYNDDEGKFYPPVNSVRFDTDYNENDTLAEYIADKKNISLASAKYFTDRYINNIKLLAQSDKTPLADLGWFYTQGTKLLFKPDVERYDPELFGYKPLTFHKLGKGPVTDNTALIPASGLEKDAAAVSLIRKPEYEAVGKGTEIEDERQRYITSVTNKPSGRNAFAFVLLAILFIGLVVVLIYRYNPALFGQQAKKPVAIKTQTATNAKVVPVDTAKKDTAKTYSSVDSASLKQNTGLTDTLTKVTPAPADSIGFPRWEVMGGTFKTLNAANTAIRNYKTLGVTAHIAQDVPGLRFHVSLGTYKSNREATLAISNLKKDRRINRGIYPLEIKHKK